MRETIRVAVAGVGNCASSVMQLVYGQLPAGDNRHPWDGVFWPKEDPRDGDVGFDIVAAFDVDITKVGLDLADAIRSGSNCTSQYRSVEPTGVNVQKGPLLDGTDGALQHRITVSEKADVDVVSELRKAKADVLVNLLPTGSLEATEFYADAAIKAGCAFVNCIPIPIATSQKWQEAFALAKLPVLGDDLKSQLGTTSFHQTLVDLIQAKGGRVVKTYQMNIGGNSDFLNMTTDRRRAFKNRTKTSAVQAHVVGLRIPDIGPNGYVAELKDNKRAHIMIEAEAALGMKVALSVDLSVEDSPNAAGVILPAVLAAYRARQSHQYGAIPDLSDNFFKMPVFPDT